MIFIVLTLIAYISIDFAVYWIGVRELLSYGEIIKHHLKMLPVYLGANILLSIGFIKGKVTLSPLLIFGLSVFLWIISLLLISIILYKTNLNTTVYIGLLIIVFGLIVVNKGLNYH